MKIRYASAVAAAILASAAACADPAANRETNTGTLLENATPPPIVDATNDASTSDVAPDGRALPTDYGITGVNETIPPTSAAGTPADNGAVQMRTDSATPVGPIP